VAANDYPSVSPSSDERYSIVVEVAAALAAKETADIRARVVATQYEHAVENTHFTVRAHRVGQDIRIDWSIKEHVEKVHLQGFRKEGGFHPDPWAGVPENGTLEVDSREGQGYLAQHLEPGKAYYYTFYIPPWTHKTSWTESPRRLDDAIARFQIRVPTVKELLRVEESLRDLGASDPDSVLQRQVQQELQRIRERLRKSHLKNQGKAQIVNELLEELRKSKLPAKDIEELEHQLNVEAEEIWLEDKRK